MNTDSRMVRRGSNAPTQILSSFVIDHIVKNFSPEQVSYFIAHKDEFLENFQKAFFVKDDYSEIKFSWVTFYKRFFNLELNFDSLVIPPKPSGEFWSLYIVVRGLTLLRADYALKKMFGGAYFYMPPDSLTSKMKSTREPVTSYAVWVKSVKKPEMLRSSASVLGDIESTLKNSITLLEMILVEMKYYFDTGIRLSSEYSTVCMGSCCEEQFPLFAYHNNQPWIIPVSTNMKYLVNPKYGIRPVCV